MLTNEFDKEDGIQLAIGGGKWYVFFCKGKGFLQKAPYERKKTLGWCSLVEEFLAYCIY